MVTIAQKEGQWRQSQIEADRVWPPFQSPVTAACAMHLLLKLQMLKSYLSVRYVGMYSEKAYSGRDKRETIVLLML
jgi:hypothetical protein